MACEGFLKDLLHLHVHGLGKKLLGTHSSSYLKEYSYIIKSIVKVGALHSYSVVFGKIEQRNCSFRCVKYVLNTSIVS